MGFPVRLCALVGRFSDPRVAESVNALIPHLLSRQVKVIVSTETTYSGDAEGIVRMPEIDIGANADLIIAIGGDGTLLYAAGLVARQPGVAETLLRPSMAGHYPVAERVAQPRDRAKASRRILHFCDLAKAASRLWARYTIG